MLESVLPVLAQAIDAPQSTALRLGVFGGTFDPVHYGHLLLAECCWEQCRLDAVWFLPAATPPHKQERELTPAAERIEMLELAVAGNPVFSVCRHEADREGVHYTVDTLDRLHAEGPSRELFFLLGADMFLDLPNWREPARVCELAVPVAVRRAGCGPVDFDCLRGIAGPERIELFRRHEVEMPEIGTSSTELRRRVAAGESIRYRTPRAVEMYIETHRLYRQPAS
jgi:nicotinate-nucleotide adenylyltransferase